MTSRVAVLGAGLTGLTAAYYLLRRGVEATVLEARPEVGGLSACFDFGDFTWDRFYHCILTTDQALLGLIEELGLSDSLRWEQTRVGFFAEENLYSMSTSADFLRFPCLSLWSKIRLALGILYTCSIRDGLSLEDIDLAPWMKRVFGTVNYRVMWEPLLKCKLGTCRDEASAAFMWATIKRLYSTRDKDGKRQERMGFVKGGYRTICDRLCREIACLGGEIRTGVQVDRITDTEGGLRVTSDRSVEVFAGIIATIPSKALVQIVPELAPDYRQKLISTKYMGIVCFALVLDEKLSPYYVTNLSVDDVPFTGIIEMTNLIPNGETSGHHLVYLPKYTAPGDPLFDMSEQELWTLFRAGLSRVFPNLGDESIKRRFLFRERFVQPVAVKHYSANLPPMRTGIPGLILANTTQIVNSTLNNNAMVEIARRAMNMATNESGVEAAEIAHDRLADSIGASRLA